MPQKKCQGGRRQHCQRPQSVFEEDETEEATEKNLNNLKNLKNQKKSKKEQQQNWTKFFFNFSKLPPKKVHKGTASAS